MVIVLKRMGIRDTMVDLIQDIVQRTALPSQGGNTPISEKTSTSGHPRRMPSLALPLNHPPDCSHDRHSVRHDCGRAGHPCRGTTMESRSHKT
eukprot:3421980-Heterocapsa_arctica.AAC.1